jgi:hypothetical protein
MSLSRQPAGGRLRWEAVNKAPQGLGMALAGERPTRAAGALAIAAAGVTILGAFLPWKYVYSCIERCFPGHPAWNVFQLGGGWRGPGIGGWVGSRLTVSAVGCRDSRRGIRDGSRWIERARSLGSAPLAWRGGMGDDTRVVDGCRWSPHRPGASCDISKPRWPSTLRLDLERHG